MQDIELTSRQVLGLLNRYLEVHKNVFNPPLKEVLTVFGLPRSVSYRENHEKLSSVKAELETLIRAVKGEDERAKTLREYSEALLSAVKSLQNICSRLHGSTTGTDTSYTRKAYKSDVKAYNELIHKYKTLGFKLNELFPKVV